MWHSNPLAGSPPPKRLPLLALQQQQEQQQQNSAGDGATTVRPMAAPEPEAEAGPTLLRTLPSAHGLRAAGAAPASAAPEPEADDALSHHGAAATEADDDGWRWVGSGAASSPSLRGPHSDRSGTAGDAAAACQGSPAEGRQPRLEQPAGSAGGSSGGAGGGGAARRQRWDQPSPLGEGNS